MAHFSDKQFERYRKFIYETFGICLSGEKKQVLQTKLDKLMLNKEIEAYEQYLDILVKGDREWLKELAESITINKTEFFRENSHFEFIRNNLKFIISNNQRILKNNEIKVWSAGCSTGKEPYTIAMVLDELFGRNTKVKILATDISRKALKTAQEGIYSAEIKDEVDGNYLNKYFEKTGEYYKISSDLEEKVTFRLFNLMEQFPFKSSFDIIFCRNVIIYFDARVQQQLIDKFYNVLAPGGLLLIGHSESLSGKTHRFQYIQPTIYMR